MNVARALVAFAILTAASPARAQKIGPTPGSASVPDARTLYLRAATVDTRTRPSVLPVGPSFDSAAHYLVQLDGPITPQRREQLAIAGVQLFDYQPMNTYLADLSAADGKAVARLDFITWIGRFDKTWKLSPDIGSAVYQSPERVGLAAAGQLRLIAYAFPDVAAEACLPALDRAGAVIRLIETPDAVRFEFDMPAANLSQLADIGGIRFVEEEPEPRPRTGVTANWISQSNITNQTPLWNAGLRGEGQIAGIIDWYMWADHCSFSDGMVPFGNAHRKIQAYYGLSGGQGFGDHGTHVSNLCIGDAPAGSDPNLTGVANKARVVFQNNNSEFSMGVNTMLTRAHNDGARVHNNSWGADGNTTYHTWSRDIDVFSRANETDLVLVAITDSNATVYIPENAKNCLAVSCTADQPGQDARCAGGGIGGFGPTADGRRKPEVMAPGCNSTSASFTQICGTSNSGSNSGGTSYACPVVTGIGLLVRQYFTSGFYPTGAAVPANAFTPSGALLKATIINSAVDMTGIAGYPSNYEGWGRVLADNAVYFPGDARKLRVFDVANAAGLSTGQSTSYNVVVAGAGQPLRITLVWTDVAGNPGTALTPTNNLDLTVTAPGSVVYRGNVFSGNESTTGGSSDALNNVEQVHRLTPTVGTYTVQISGTAIAVSTQGYALVVTGDVSSAAYDCGSALRGDTNGDGLINGKDVASFISMMLGFDGTVNSPAECRVDIGGSGNHCTPDGALNTNDIPGFVALLLNGACS